METQRATAYFNRMDRWRDIALSRIYARGLLGNEGQPPPPQGMNKRELEKIYEHVKFFERTDDEEEQRECFICLAEFETDDMVVELKCVPNKPPHLYHIPCIEPWLKCSASCPACKRAVKF